MIDIEKQLHAVHRQVEAGAGESVGVLLRRTYPAPPEDVWDALTDPDRLTRWFLPISGDLRVGGSFQLEGNAGGEIRRCERPNLIEVTFGGPTSIVAVRLAARGEDTVLELEHTVPVELAGSGAGALYVGPGWDGAVMSLALYLDGEVADDPVAAANSLEAQEYCTRSVHAWAERAAEADAATPEEIAAAIEAALAQFAPDLVAPQEDSPGA